MKHNETGFLIDALSVQDLRAIRTGCPQLVTLEVDVPLCHPIRSSVHAPTPRGDDAKVFPEVLAIFQSLQNLYMQFQHRLGPLKHDPMWDKIDTGCEDAERIMRSLHRHKEGLPFSTLMILLNSAFRPPNWRSDSVVTEDLHHFVDLLSDQ